MTRLSHSLVCERHFPLVCFHEDYFPKEHQLVENYHWRDQRQNALASLLVTGRNYSH